MFDKSLLTRSYSFQGKTVKNAGWDFSIGGSQSIGTVRSLKPPQARERRQEVPSNTSQRTTRASGIQLSPTSGSTVPEASEGGFVKRRSYQNDHEDGFHEEVRSFAFCVPDAVCLLSYHFFAVTVAPGNNLIMICSICTYR